MKIIIYGVGARGKEGYEYTSTENKFTKYSVQEIIFLKYRVQ